MFKEMVAMNKEANMKTVLEIAKECGAAVGECMIYNLDTVMFKDEAQLTATIEAWNRQSEPIYTNGDRQMTMKVRNFTHEGKGCIQDNNFDFDATLYVDGDVHSLQCVIRVSITPFIKWYSNDWFYKAKDESRLIYKSFETAANAGMLELVERLEGKK